LNGKRNRFERIGNVLVSFLGNTIAIDIPTKYTPRGARIKLWTRTTITDPITRSFLKLSALTRNYTIVLADGADNRTRDVKE